MDFEEVKKEREAKHQKFLGLKAKTPQEREAMGLSLQQAQCDFLDISVVTYNRWQKKLQKAEQDPQDEIDLADDKLNELAMLGKNPKYMELWYKRKGLLNEKKEDKGKFELTVNDRIRIAREVVNGLRAECNGNNRSCPLCHQSIVFSSKVCMDSEPKYEESGKMATVGVSA